MTNLARQTEKILDEAKKQQVEVIVQMDSGRPVRPQRRRD